MPAADELEALLIIWGRWDRNRLGIAECGSVEHKWDSPQPWYEVVPEFVVPLTVAEKLAALRVQRAWQRVPVPYNWILRDWYVFRRNPQATCRAHALRFIDFDSYERNYVATARIILRNILTFQGQGV